MDPGTVVIPMVPMAIDELAKYEKPPSFSVLPSVLATQHIEAAAEMPSPSYADATQDLAPAVAVPENAASVAMEISGVEIPTAFVPEFGPL